MGDFQLEHPPIKDGVKVRQKMLLSALEPMQGCEGTYPAMLPNLSINLGSTSSQQRMHAGTCYCSPQLTTPGTYNCSQKISVLYALVNY